MDKQTATELTNKLRWAIGSTLKDNLEGGFRLEYRDSLSLASLLTDQIFGVLSALRVAQNSQDGFLIIDRKLLSSLLTQETLSF